MSVSVVSKISDINCGRYSSRTTDGGILKHDHKVSYDLTSVPSQSDFDVLSQSLSSVSDALRQEGKRVDEELASVKQALEGIHAHLKEFTEQMQQNECFKEEVEKRIQKELSDDSRFFQRFSALNDEHLSNVQAKVNQIQDTGHTVQQTLQRVEDLEKETKQLLSSMESNKDLIQQMRSEIEQETATAKREGNECLTRVRKECSDAEELFQTLSSEFADLKKQLKDAEDRIQCMEATAAQLLSSMESNKDLIQQMRSEIEQETATAKREGNECLTRVRKKCSDAEELFQTVSSEFADLKKQLKDAEDRIQCMEATAAQRLNEEEKRLQQMTKAMEAYSTKLKAMEAEREEERRQSQEVFQKCLLLEEEFELLEEEQEENTSSFFRRLAFLFFGPKRK